MEVMIYSPVAPSTKSSGSLMLYQLLRLNREDNFYCFCVVDPIRRTALELPGKNVHVSRIKRPLENAFRLTRFALDEPIGFIFEKFKQAYINWVIIPAAVRYGKKNDVDEVWAILQGKTIISSAQKIAKRLNRPLVSQVWDEPSWIIKDTNLDRWSSAETLRNYEQALCASRTIACASFAMARMYQKYCKQRTVILGSLKSLFPSSQPSNKFFTIGFAGQMYAKAEWNSFIQALSILDFKIDGRPVRIKVLGKFSKKDFRSLPVDVLGYKPQAEAMRILSKTDFNYCPYWFDKVHENIARTSFPSKLTSYLACQRPVLFHGPSYSAPAEFLKDNSIDCVCDSMKSEAIRRKIEEIIESKNSADLIKKGNLAFKRYLTHDYQKRQLERFLK